MKDLCEKDGGVKVYEPITLADSEFKTLKDYVITEKSGENYFGPDYRYVTRREILAGKRTNPQSGDGQLARLYWAIYRRSDNRLLGEQVEYRRNGGDLFTFGFQPSSKSCPHFERGIEQLVFIKAK